MKNLLIRAGVAVLGVALMLAWWTFRGGSDDKTTVTSKIPAKVGAVGAGTLTIEIESTCEARFSINFAEHEKDPGSQTNLEAWERVSPGARSWTIDIPAGVGGYIDLSSDKAKVGDKLKWRILLNGTVLDEQTETLEQPLQPNTALGLQAYYDDYSKAQKEKD